MQRLINGRHFAVCWCMCLKNERADWDKGKKQKQNKNKKTKKTNKIVLPLIISDIIMLATAIKCY